MSWARTTPKARTIGDKPPLQQPKVCGRIVSNPETGDTTGFEDISPVKSACVNRSKKVLHNGQHGKHLVIGRYSSDSDVGFPKFWPKIPAQDKGACRDF